MEKNQFIESVSLIVDTWLLEAKQKAELEHMRLEIDHRIAKNKLEKELSNKLKKAGITDE